MISDSIPKSSMHPRSRLCMPQLGAGEGYYTPTLPVITVDDFANANPVPVSVTFKRGGSNLGVTGFTSR